ncbi:probable 60S ribosomal protein L26-B [Nakaseomyces glabratus]|nr:probable 60S ribosomal protein L26-B [Nakaseomyces glabratus]
MAKQSLDEKINVSSDRRKARKAYFTASSSERRVLLSAPLSKELRAQYGVKLCQSEETTKFWLPVVPRRVKKVTKEKSNGASVPIALHPSKVVITKLHLDKDRKNLIQRRGGKLE